MSHEQGLRLRRPGQKFISFWVWRWLVIRSRDHATDGMPPLSKQPRSRHYFKTERDHERNYQAILPQGRKAAGGCKPRHGRGDSKRERSFSGLKLQLQRQSKHKFVKRRAHTQNPQNETETQNGTEGDPNQEREQRATQIKRGRPGPFSLLNTDLFTGYGPFFAT